MEKLKLKFLGDTKLKFLVEKEIQIYGKNIQFFWKKVQIYGKKIQFFWEKVQIFDKNNFIFFGKKIFKF